MVAFVLLAGILSLTVPGVSQVPQSLIVSPPVPAAVPTANKTGTGNLFATATAAGASGNCAQWTAAVTTSCHGFPVFGQQNTTSKSSDAYYNLFAEAVASDGSGGFANLSTGNFLLSALTIRQSISVGRRAADPAFCREIAKRAFIEHASCRALRDPLRTRLLHCPRLSSLIS